MVSLAMTTPLAFVADLLVRIISTVGITVVTSLVVSFINRRFPPPVPHHPAPPAPPAPPKDGTIPP